MSFPSAIALERRGPGEHGAAIDPAWAQGRGAYGGLVAAMLVRAIEAEAPEGQAVVSLHASFCAPATEGPATIRTEIVRSGRSVSTIRATMSREGTIATAIATLARPRTLDLVHEGRKPPAVPAPESTPDGPEEHYIPVFARFFELRQALGPRPFSGGKDARVGGWCRLRGGGAAVDRALVCALMDAWPPAAVALSNGWRSVASLDLTIDFSGTAAPDEWLLYDARCDRIEGGLADESASLYGQRGQLIATARQRIALFPQEPLEKESAGRPSRREGL